MDVHLAQDGRSPLKADRLAGAEVERGGEICVAHQCALGDDGLERMNR